MGFNRFFTYKTRLDIETEKVDKLMAQYNANHADAKGTQCKYQEGLQNMSKIK